MRTLRLYTRASEKRAAEGTQQEAQTASGLRAARVVRMPFFDEGRVAARS